MNLEDLVSDSLFIGAPGSDPNGAGNYWLRLETGISIWEAGVYFVGQ